MTPMEQFRPAHVIAEDTALAHAFRDGDDAAVRALYERYGGLVFTVANRVVGGRQRAEDITQHTFLQAWRNADRFEPGRDFAPWLATIARRAAIDALGREQRRPTASIETADPGDAALVSLPPSAEQVETVWGVRAAIESLDDEERSIVKLQHLDGYTHSQIAEHLGIVIGTVTSRSHRAHRRLAKRLAYLRDSQGSDES